MEISLALVFSCSVVKIKFHNFGFIVHDFHILFSHELELRSGKYESMINSCKCTG
jgi:hypothetical protein